MVAGNLQLTYVAEFFRVKGLVILHGNAKEKRPFSFFVGCVQPVQQSLCKHMVAEVIAPGIGTSLNVQVQFLYLTGKQQAVKPYLGVSHRAVIKTVVVCVKHLCFIARRLKGRCHGVQQAVIPVVPEGDVGAGFQILSRQAGKNGLLDVAGAIAQITGIKSAGNSLPAQPVKIFRGIAGEGQPRQTGHVVK
ncbi:hypothetical protein SDC9_133978 [bioreactor metagenome]|uniref:Uncharacterized protein n=1 Tax=bioreactor metagenome TaxID=1076179 RepID=A0A645DCG2_9ZZZZ